MTVDVPHMVKFVAHDFADRTHHFMAYRNAWLAAPRLHSRLVPLTPLAHDPILLISMPRSGSTWLGSLLGAAANAMYLNEPVTQGHKGLRRDRPTVVDPGHVDRPDRYQRILRDAMRGIPSPRRMSAPRAEQWIRSERRTRRLVVKEVNPLALGHLMSSGSPTVVHLVRHPVAVANSFYARGWAIDRLTYRIERSLGHSEATPAPDGSDSFWSAMGWALGTIHATTERRLESHSSSSTVTYEDLCLHPREVTQQLYDANGLQWSSDTESLIVRSTSSQTAYVPGRYDTDRDSAKMPQQWRTQVARDDIAALRSSYERTGARFYRDEHHWP